MTVTIEEAIEKLTAGGFAFQATALLRYRSKDGDKKGWDQWFRITFPGLVPNVWGDEPAEEDLPKQTPPLIYVTMEGGLCQGVSSNDPALIGAGYVVIDYDTDGSSDELDDVRQSDGSISEACIGGGVIDRLEVEILEKDADEIISGEPD